MEAQAPYKPAVVASWPELCASLLAIGATLTSVFSLFHLRESYVWGSDFKTLYAAALCFRQRLDPYSFANIAAVFRANHVVTPPTWFGHAPVYPPFTLALVAPFTHLPMVPAVYLWDSLSALALAAAIFALARSATTIFGVTRPWRMLLIVLFAITPLLSFGLKMGNVSPLVAALSILAITASSSVFAPFALALALLLKPHLAVWVVVALVLTRSKQDRRLALRSVVLTTVAALAVFGWLAATHQLLPQLASYQAMVHAETAGGSMDPSSHELMAAAAQITSAASLIGYWLTGLARNIVTAITLITLASCLIAASLKDELCSADDRLLRICSWCAFGMVVTYHRAHDAAMLLLFLPCAIARLRANRSDRLGWWFLLLILCMGSDVVWASAVVFSGIHGLWHVCTLIAYRQAPIAALLLAVLLTGEAVRRKRTRPSLTGA